MGDEAVGEVCTCGGDRPEQKHAHGKEVIEGSGTFFGK